MTTYIYKGKSISHSKLLMLLHSAHIYGGNKLSHYEVLLREAEKVMSVQQISLEI